MLALMKATGNMEIENEALIQLRSYQFLGGGLFLLISLFKTIYNEEWKKS